MTTGTIETGRQNGGVGRTADQMRLQPLSRWRERLPEIVLGAGLMTAVALVFVLWHASSTQREPVLALARAVGRGAVIEAGDVRVIYVDSDDPVAHLGGGDRSAVVGRMAAADLPAGALLTRQSVISRPAVAEGEGVVGLALEPGQFPAGDLSVGDVVNVVAGGGAVGADGRDASVVAREAVVYAVEELGNQGNKVVSLKLPATDANRVAAAAEAGPLRLVLLSEASSATAASSTEGRP